MKDNEKERIERLHSYLSNNADKLVRYKDKIDCSGEKEFRNMGVQENQNYILITRRMKHRRMSWTKKGATNLALIVCDSINKETWSKIERKNNSSVLNEDVLVSATIKSVDKIRKKLLKNEDCGLNERVIKDMVDRLRNVSLA